MQLTTQKLIRTPVRGAVSPPPRTEQVGAGSAPARGRKPLDRGPGARPSALAWSPTGTSSLPEGAAVLTRRIGQLAWAGVVAVSLLLFIGPVGVVVGTTPALDPRLAALGLLLGFLVLVGRPGFPAYQAPAALLLTTTLAGLAAHTGVLFGSLAVTVSLMIVLMLATSAMLPWGVLFQIALVATCAVATLTTATVLGSASVGDANLMLMVNASAGAILSLFAAYQNRSDLDVALRETRMLHAVEAERAILRDDLEAEIRSRTAELERALSDQRVLTRAISHDLRQPLRHIEGYAEMLEEDLRPSLDDDSRKRLDKVKSATTRTWRMVDALLELTRVGSSGVHRRPVDLSSLASEVLEDLRRMDRGRRVEVVVEENLVEHCDDHLARVLLEQLFSNAWKFTQERADARIEFGRTEGQLWVRDNGAGFDMRFSSRLFRAFEKLHESARFEGEGAGLAIAERVVLAHGGRIRGESEPGQGAIFYFTLSRKN